MRRTDVNDGREENLAGSSSSAVGPDRRLDAVIPFSRRAAIAAASGSAGATETSSAAPSFIPVGIAVAAVVLRLRGGFPRIQALRIAEEEQESDPEL
jgi:hypothetical protein